MELVKLARRRTTDDVYHSLRNAILNRVFLPGERLQIPDIANKLGVSSTPLRHAIQRLSTEGLIVVHPRSGTFVATLDVNDIAETFDIRCALECLAAERAVEHVGENDVEHLRELLAGLASGVTTEAELRAHEQLNSEFHSSMVRLSGNRRLQELYESLEANIQIARVHLVEGYRGGRFDLEQREHEEIVAALQSCDVARLQHALRQHIQRAKGSLIQSLKTLPDFAKPGS
jgi:GntR family transcriptional regulator, rspAB operon transcriptional repressor